MRIAFLALALALALAAGAASAAERLVLAPYPGPPAWREVTNKENAAQWLHEQIPAGQSIDSYRDILTSQGFKTLRNTDPAAYLSRLFGLAAGACERVSVNGPKAAREGGFAVAYGQLYCSRQKGAAFGVVIFYKAIQGAEGLYVVDRDFRVPPMSAPGVIEGPNALALARAQAAADRYLVESVYVCGDRSADRRCR